MLSFSTKPTIKHFLILLFLLSGFSAGGSAQETVDPADEIFKQVFGDSEEEESDTILEIPVGLFIEGRYVGDIPAKIRGGGNSVLLERETLLSMLEKELMEEKTDVLPDILTDPYISFALLQDLGIEVYYDSILLRVSLGIPPELRKPGTLMLKDAPKTYSPDMITADPFSAYFNYYTQAGLLYDRDADQSEAAVSFRGRMDPVFQLYRWVLEGGGSYDTEGSPQFEFDYLRLIKDFPAAGLRFAAGTIHATAAGSISSLPIDGVSIGTESALSSLSEQYSPLTREILLQQPAEVSIYLNGRLLKRSRLDAGIHTLVDFPLVGGLNDVRIVITEQDGSERVLTSFVPFDSGLLKPREYSFAVSAGTPQHEFADPLAAGFFSYGLHRNASLGLSFQADADAAVANLFSLFSTPVGNIGGNFGVSLPFSGEPGYTGQVNYRLSYPSRRRLPSLGLQFEYTGNSFLRNVNSEPVNQYVYRIRSVLGQALPLDSFVSLSSTYSAGRDDTGDSLQASLTFLKGLEKVGSLSLGFSLSGPVGEELEWQGNLSFSINPGSNTGRTAMYSQDLKNGQGGANFSWRDEKKESLYTASLSGYPPVEKESTSLDAGAYFSTPWFRTNITNSFYGAPGRGLEGDRFSGSLGGAVLFTGGRFALARPLQDSFVMVVPGPDLGDELLAVQNIRGGGGLKEGTGKPLSFTEVRSYSPFSIRFELPYTPPDVVLEQDSVTLLPSYRSGSTITVGLKKTVYAEGRLLTLDGEPIKLQAGSVINPDTPEGDVVFFTDEEGFFQLHDLGPGSYQLSLFADDFARKDFNVPRDAVNPYQIGALVLPVVQK